jgi:hypothetical protein
VKRSPTSTPENDEEYEDREMNYEAECWHIRGIGAKI